MTALTDLICAVTEHPDEQAPADMLADFLIEHHEHTRESAQREVQFHQRCGFEAREVAQAAKLLAQESDCRIPIRAAACASVNLHHGTFTLFIVEGGHWPIIRTRRGPKRRGASTREHFIYVGARWVLNLWRLHTDNGRLPWQFSYGSIA